MSEPEYDVWDDLGSAGIKVIQSDLVPPGTFYLVPDLPHALRWDEPLWQRVPERPRWEAVKIVQEGMADVVAWLRANGHHIPTWQQQEDAASRWHNFTFDATERMTLQVKNPRHWAKITGSVL